MSNSERKVHKSMRGYYSYSITADENLEKNLKQLNDMKIGTRFYNAGRKWFRDGNKIEDVIANPSLVGIDNDVLLNRFVRGFETAIRDYGNDFGYKGIRIEELPEEYINNKFFLDGYRTGLIQYEKEEARKNKHR